ncbi:MAG: hypothetical protein E7575_06735 [Ruminococcaceae bacterium]|nr:hypothetical protein [Oscillospiraceae bacterium]
MNRTKGLIDKLKRDRALSESEYRYIIENRTGEIAEYAASIALEEKERYYGKSVFIRGLIEISNICRNDCLYCGIRKSNRDVCRYRLSPRKIQECCRR